MSDTSVTNERTNDLPVAHVSVNVTIDDDCTVINNAGEVGQSDSNDQSSHEEKMFYSKVNCYESRLKFVEKVILSLDYYQKILFAVKLAKGGKTACIDNKFYNWCKKHFKINNTAGHDILVSLKNDRRIVFTESYFTILKDIHEKTGHGGRDKMRYEFSHHYYWLPSTVIDLFLQCCVSCQLRKPVKNPVVSTAIISIGYMTRLQMDLIDLRTRPDKDFQWILHCRDHYSKYS
ncbi:unnamed protein product [Rotaria sp. Silwood2]|nr:unnamed protein product [Rotaria sp. Silwood2]CAF3395367.1 unnamed protein product [Rotaria sp. Silwood2]CAF3950214.1 unnamed protein product [Rotaria sp. Silwood2]